MIDLIYVLSAKRFMDNIFLTLWVVFAAYVVQNMHILPAFDFLVIVAFQLATLVWIWTRHTMGENKSK